MNIFGGRSRNDENRKYIGAKAAIAKLIINYHNLGCVWDKLFIFDLDLMFSWSSYAMEKKYKPENEIQDGRHYNNLR